jgi:hypothetical protein
MTITDWTGFIGVTILLVAFYLNLRSLIAKNGLIYLGMNFAGAGIACIASILLKYLPFIILEGCWTIVSMYGLVRYFRKTEAIQDLF